ncbi:MAG: P1 family peptidase [Gemmatimonadota bacterium]
MSGGTPNRSLTAIPGLAVGHSQDVRGGTGCTVVTGPFAAGADVRGLGTGTREIETLSPLHLVGRCDAILLTGGSAFGLAAADGVVRWLEERGIGYETPGGPVPIVPAAVIYDLVEGEPGIRPDAEMGYTAAEAATRDPVPEGRVGAGTGATVGKLRGRAGAELGGLGCWAEAGSGFAVAALAVVNAFGDVRDGAGSILAGTRDEAGRHLDTARALAALERGPEFGGESPGADPRPGLATTLAVVATDAALDRPALTVVARQAMNAIARRISPSNTQYDGDVVFAVSPAGAGGPAGPSVSAAEVLAIGVRAQAVLERAIERAVT